MINSSLDHLVVTSPSLAAGISFVEERLGVMMQTGGQHVRMGTHNAVLRIGKSSYLEVIAVNPEAPPVGRPRWFDLDQLNPRGTPRLATWVVRTSNIDQAVDNLRVHWRTTRKDSEQAGEAMLPESTGQLPQQGDTAMSESLGRVEAMSRGQLEWRITIPADGSLPFDGIAPSLIEWNTGEHPAEKLNDCGVSLVQLQGFHPQADSINAMLMQIGFTNTQDVAISEISSSEPPRLIARLRTPRGLVQLM